MKHFLASVLILVTIVICSINATPMTHASKAYAEWKNEHGKSYSSDTEEALRL